MELKEWVFGVRTTKARVSNVHTPCCAIDQRETRLCFAIRERQANLLWGRGTAIVTLLLCTFAARSVGDRLRMHLFSTLITREKSARHPCRGTSCYPV
jgi:hypothetical protein